MVLTPVSGENFGRLLAQQAGIGRFGRFGNTATNEYTDLNA
jgi:epoxyqueuosine reductase QueG